MGSLRSQLNLTQEERLRIAASSPLIHVAAEGPSGAEVVGLHASMAVPGGASELTALELVYLSPCGM